MKERGCPGRTDQGVQDPEGDGSTGEQDDVTFLRDPLLLVLERRIIGVPRKIVDLLVKREFISTLLKL